MKSNYLKITEIIDAIEPLIQSAVTAESVQFLTWYDKATLFLNRKYGADSYESNNFHSIVFSRTDVLAMNGYPPVLNQVAICKTGLQIAEGVFKNMRDDMEDDSQSPFPDEKKCCYDNKKIFIVHGRNGELKEAVARLVEKQGIEAIILSEQANQGRTIIEKFEDNSDVGGAICLFTADDVGNEKSQEQMNPRARQNVVFEAGFFMGKLGRNHVILLADKGVEMPSDLSGVVYSDAKYWQFDVLRELDAMGYQVDFNKLK